MTKSVKQNRCAENSWILRSNTSEGIHSRFSWYRASCSFNRREIDGVALFVDDVAYQKKFQRIMFNIRTFHKDDPTLEPTASEPAEHRSFTIKKEINNPPIWRQSKTEFNIQLPRNNQGGVFISCKGLVNVRRNTLQAKKTIFESRTALRKFKTKVLWPVWIRKTQQNQLQKRGLNANSSDAKTLRFLQPS